MNVPLLPKLVLAFMAASTALAAASSLPRSSPAQAGVSSSGIEAFIRDADAIHTVHSFMLLRHGKIVAEHWWAPHSADEPHELYSASKSFTSTAVGLAIADGKLHLDDLVLKLFPDEAPAHPSANLSALRVRDLLTLTSGHDQDLPPPPRGVNWVPAYLAMPVPHRPGTFFFYDSGAVYVLSAIVQKTTGQNLLEYLKPRLFDPLGIDHPTWALSPQGVAIGASGLRLRTEDLAKFGQLYLHHGRWNGRQLIPVDWVTAATTKEVSNEFSSHGGPNPDWHIGFGYLFWLCRHDAYRAAGHNSQYCIVMPSQDAVVAITADDPQMAPLLQRVWDDILPAMSPPPGS